MNNKIVLFAATEFEQEVSAWVEFAGDHMSHVSLSDDWCAEYRLYISTFRGEQIDDRIRFGERLSVAGEALFGSWGDNDSVKSARYRECESSHSSRSEARRLCLEYVQSELYNLVNAVLVRKDAAAQIAD
jgi:hypothetical protein